jgi:hypothetical protein
LKKGNDRLLSIKADCTGLKVIDVSPKFTFTATIARNAIAGTEAVLGTLSNAASTSIALLTLGEVEITGKAVNNNKFNQTVGMILYGNRDGNDGPGAGYSTDNQYESIDMSAFWTTGWESVAAFGEKTGDFLGDLFSRRSIHPHGYNNINPKGLDSLVYTIDSGGIDPNMSEYRYMVKYYYDGVVHDSLYQHWKWFPHD